MAAFRPALALPPACDSRFEQSEVVPPPKVGDDGGHVRFGYVDRRPKAFLSAIPLAATVIFWL